MFELTPTQVLVQETARAFARDRVASGARERDRSGKFATELFQGLAELGLLGVNVPEALGGAGAGPVAYALAMIEISQACASTAVAMAVTNMSAELIARFAQSAVAERLVPKLTAGEAVVGAFALSEAHCGSDPGALRTTAQRRGDRYVLNGSKQWITSGAQAGVVVVWARTGQPDSGTRGLSAFAVDLTASGGGLPRGWNAGKPEDKMGLRASTTVPLTFEDCEVPAENLLGAEGDGFKLAMIALDGGRIGVASQACGLSGAALKASVSYVRNRQAFGQPIGDFQAVRFQLANVATELEAARLLVLRAAALKEAGKPFSKEASMAKLFASEAANRHCDRAVQLHGGYGYIDEFPVERYFRDARVTTIYEGTSEIQRLVIARALLKAAS